MPKPSDLSFYNWETQTSTSNATQNFQARAARLCTSWAPRELGSSARRRDAGLARRPQVIADNEAGLLFKNKRDRKVINVDPKSRPGDNSRRIELQTHEYIQAHA